MYVMDIWLATIKKIAGRCNKNVECHEVYDNSERLFMKVNELLKWRF